MSNITDLSDKEIKHILTILNLSPLSIPTLAGLFVRIVTEELQKGRLLKVVGYRTTRRINAGLDKCAYGNVLENVEELDNFLRTAGMLNLSIDHFCFNPEVNVTSVLKDENECWSRIMVNKDLSDGREYFPVSVLNPVDDDQEVNFVQTYITTNIFSKDTFGQDLGLSSTCCQCENDCKDKLNCPCFQLTLANYDPIERKKIGDNKIGYDFKKLTEDQITLSGIFECNKNCKCKWTCWNKVVQNGSKWRFQIVKGSKGWGVRTLTDIPKGSFISTYTGMIRKDSSANSPNWQKELDEWKYLINLNVTRNFANRNGKRSTKRRRRKLRRRISKEGAKGQDKNILTTCTFINTKPKSKSFRKIDSKGFTNKLAKHTPKNSTAEFFLESQTKQSYVLDAKEFGNIGKYFNHSCNPNMFPQYVFTDTHDLRFPCVSLFAVKDIRLGDELTWNYNYDTHSSAVEKCLCDSDNCSRKLY